MTEDCPGYDRDRRTCLVRPDDCEFAPGDGEVVLIVETPDRPRDARRKHGDAPRSNE